MKITLPKGCTISTDALVTQLLFALAGPKGRFSFEIVCKNRVLTLRNIRLVERKPYCGNHPAACDVHGGPRMRLLEGADWVDWNDRLNDTLDALGVEARVESAVCTIRKGRLRRTSYSVGQIIGGTPQWAKDEPAAYWHDCIGVPAPASWYPPGTPGLYTREVRL